jgi:hypothetical protein
MGQLRKGGHAAGCPLQVAARQLANARMRRSEADTRCYAAGGRCGSGRGMLQSAGLESEEWGGGRGGSARRHRRGSGANRVGERRQAGAVEKLWGQEGVWVVGKQLVGQVE